jgi:hypothetical protein
LSWSGRDWYVRQSSGLEGPGPNVFDSSSRSVWVDSKGYLHMKVRKQGRSWLSSEVFTQQPLGLGTYTFVAEVPPSLDPNVTVGMFTYQDDTHEYDVELAKWGNAADPANAQFAVQPNDVYRFTSPSGAQTFRYVWNASSINFGAWNYAGPSFWTGAAPVHINVWQFQGRPPASGRDVEVVIRSFNYQP